MAKDSGLNDAHLLVAKLHREALLRMTCSADEHFQGLGVAARFLGLSSNWKRKARELDAVLGIVEKISEQSICKFLRELDDELVKSKSGCCTLVLDNLVV